MNNRRPDNTKQPTLFWSNSNTKPLPNNYDLGTIAHPKCRNHGKYMQKAAMMTDSNLSYNSKRMLNNESILNI